MSSPESEASTGALAPLLAGLRSSSPPVLLSGLLLAVVFLVLIELAFASGTLWRIKLGWLLSGPLDDWTYALWNVKQFDPTRPVSRHVFLVGGSSAREALTSNESVSAALSENAAQPHVFLNLGTRNQTLAESVVLIDNLPPSDSGLIVFGLHPIFFRDDLGDALDAWRGVHYPMDSPALNDVLEGVLGELPHVVSFDVFRYRAWIANYLSARLRSRSLLRSLDYVNHIYIGHRPPALAPRLAQVGGKMVGYKQNFGLNAKLLDAAITVSREKGYRVLLVSLPRNPVGDRTVLEPYLAHYFQALQGLAQREGVEFIDMHGRLQLERTAFFDHVHLLSDSRDYFQRHFVDLLLHHLDPS